MSEDTGMTPVTNTWMSVAIVQEGPKTSCYVDGSFTYSETANTLNVGDKACFTTSSGSNNNRFEGDIMNATYYDWALPAWAIASLAAQTYPTS